MKLFISGGGGKEDSFLLDQKFAEAIGNNKPLLYIPIAMMDDPRYPYPGCYKWISGVFNPLGVDKIEMWLEKELEEKKDEDLNNFSGVYIGGGNTFYLLKKLRETGFIKKLEVAAKNNLPIYGGSAGGLILAKTIIPALSYDPNVTNLTDMTALNLIQDYDAWFHYVPEMDELIREYKNKYNLKIVALPENAGLCFTDDGIEEVGPGQVRYF